MIHNETFTIKYIVNVPVHSPGHCTQTVCRLPYFIKQSGAEEGEVGGKVMLNTLELGGGGASKISSLETGVPRMPSIKAINTGYFGETH